MTKVAGVRCTVDTSEGKLASFPGHSQILSCSCGKFSPHCLRDTIWEWPGDESTGKLQKEDIGKRLRYV